MPIALADAEVDPEIELGGRSKGNFSWLWPFRTRSSLRDQGDEEHRNYQARTT